MPPAREEASPRTSVSSLTSTVSSCCEASSLQRRWRQRMQPSMRSSRCCNPETRPLSETPRPARLDASGPRLDMGGMLFWEQPHCEVFRNMLCHPKLVPYITELCGMAYRLDHQPLLLAQERDSEGFSQHGGPVTSDGRFNPTLQYRCEQGQLWTSLLAVSFQLCDHNPGDGGFCVVRSSHDLSPATPRTRALQPRAPPLCNPIHHRCAARTSSMCRAPPTSPPARARPSAIM